MSQLSLWVMRNPSLIGLMPLLVAILCLLFFQAGNPLHHLLSETPSPALRVAP